MIPIFDSLTHPTITGAWLSSKYDASFESLASKQNRAVAVGLHGVEGYNHDEFIQECNKYDNLIPVAGFDIHVSDLTTEISNVTSLGFKGIKLHPRLGNFSFNDDKEKLKEIFKLCFDHKLVVFVCTYVSCSSYKFPTNNPFWDLADIFKSSPNTKCVLLHGGTTRLLEYADLVRFNPNLLLDLSYTIIKYKGSSLDLDMRYLFQTFDQKLCVGTDHPEYTLDQLRFRLDEIGEGISSERLENIYHKNLSKFFDV